jgi:hypothetical protein
MPPVKEIQEGDENITALGESTGNEDQNRIPPCSSCLDWWYRSSTEWVLWYVIASKQPDPDLHVAGQSPSRIDSGIALSVPKYDAAPRDPDPLTFTFHLDDRTYTKTLVYEAFVGWASVDALLDELNDDGIIVYQLWDVTEDMEVNSGDWEARVRPGWKLDMYCQHSDHYERPSDCISDDYESDDSDGEEDEDQSDKERHIERTSDAAKLERQWWFARWKKRVEKEKCRKKKAHQEPSWIVMLIWASSMVAFIALVSVLAV